VKRLSGALIVALFVLVSCSHKEACKSEKAACKGEKAVHECTKACDHSAHKAMAKDHVCTEACDHSAAAMAKTHVCSDDCKAECKAAHMEKHGADHVCTDACKAECKLKAEHGAGEHAGEAVKETPETEHEGGEVKD